uniref:Mediator of RNA polymerase II transcription subunit 27 n=1 Tax=Globodera rostochiensis TaxID=31243 RepID=A0A914GZ91_GLORO
MGDGGGDVQVTMPQLCNSIEKCLQHLRALKSQVISTHNLLAEKIAVVTRTDGTSPFELDGVREELEKAAGLIADEYNKIESEAKALPAQTPQSLMINKLNHFLLDCATNQDMAGGVYCNTRNVFDWSDSTASFVNYAYDLFKMANASYLTQQRNRKLTLAHQWTVRHEPLATIPVEPSSYAQQRKFELALSDYVQKYQSTRHPVEPFFYRLVLNHLEQSALSSAIELKFLSLPRANYKMADKNGPSVCLLKALLLVNNGSIDYVHFVAPHEEWHFNQLPRFGNKKQIDLSVPSRYELYHKFNMYGNVVINFLSNCPNMNAKIFTAFFNQLARLYTIDQRCSRCGKRLREFSPVITTEQPKNTVHLTCK